MVLGVEYLVCTRTRVELDSGECALRTAGIAKGHKKVGTKGT